MSATYTVPTLWCQRRDGGRSTVDSAPSARRPPIRRAARAYTFRYARPTMSAALLDELDLRAPDAAATQAIAVRLAAVALPGDVLCLWGDLGAGKTQFAKGFGAGLGITDTINSPTFVLMAEYRGRLPLFHLDLYRLDDARDALAGGLLDEREGTGVTLIEWPDRMRDLLPNARLDISIEGVGDEPRTIRLATADPSLRRYLAAV